MAEMTELSPAEEKSFLSWIKGTEWFKEYVKEYDEAPDLVYDRLRLSSCLEGWH